MTAPIPSLQEIHRTLASVQANQTVRLTFKKESTIDPFYLIGMACDEMIIIDSITRKSIQDVGKTNDWDDIDKRTFQIRTTTEFDGMASGWFTGRMLYAVEKVEIVSD